MQRQVSLYYDFYEQGRGVAADYGDSLVYIPGDLIWAPLRALGLNKVEIGFLELVMQT